MKLLFLIKEGFLGFRRARLATLITILTISLSLTLIGLFGLVVYHLSDGFKKTFSRINLEVYVDPTATASQITDLQTQISNMDAVEGVRYISPTEALQSFKSSFGEDMVEVLDGENPLQPSFRVTLKSDYAEVEKIQQVKQKIEAISSVDEIVYQEQLVRLVNEYFFAGTVTAVAFGATIFLISAILIFNTIRLTIHSRKSVIEIMRLVGATQSFIKAPFIFEGVLQGLIGSLIACLGLWLISGLLAALFATTFAVPWFYYIFLVITGIFLGLIGSYFSVGKYLRF